MGISVIKVGLLVGAFILPLFVEASNICEFGKQYWSDKTGSCVDCTRCRNRDAEVVIRPCHVYADTICGPISALKLEWPVRKHHGHHKQENEETQNHHKNRFIHIYGDPFLHLDHLYKDPSKNIEEWERLLKQSKAQLQHKKEDLMKSLLQRKNAAIHHSKDWEDEELEDINSENKQSHEFSSTHRPHISKLDLEIFEKLVKNEHKNRNRRPLEPFDKSLEDKHLIDHKKEFEKVDSRDFPDEYDFLPVGPNHRLFRGEPSTVPEMMIDQNIRTLEQTVLAERVPFTTAETFVWDWQAVAFFSAITACILFFALAAVYSVLHARQLKKLKNHFNIDIEDLALRVSLMQSGGLNNATSSDVNNSNHYLEQLIAEKKLGENKSNIYIEKQPS